MLDGKRGDRRARTLRVALARRKLHLGRVHGGRVGNLIERVDCVCELAAFYFEDKTAIGCGCRRRRRGRPRLACGICRYSWRRPIYRARRLWRDQAREIMSGQLDPDEAGWIAVKHR